MFPSTSNPKLEAQDTLIFSDQEYQEMRSQLTSNFQYLYSFPSELNDPLRDQYDIRSYQEISHNKLASAKKSFEAKEGRIKILKVTSQDGKQKEVILYFKDGKLHQHIQSIDPQNVGMVEKVAKDIDFYINLTEELIKIGNEHLLAAKQLFLKNSKEKKFETLDSYKKLKSEVIEILGTHPANQDIEKFIKSFAPQDDDKKYLDVANIVVAQQFMRSVAFRKQVSASHSSDASGGGSFNLASDPVERAKVTGRGITVDYDTQKPTQITVKRYNYDHPGHRSPVSNVVYIKIKKLTDGGELAKSDQKKFGLSGKNRFCFLKISFDASGEPKIDTDNVYVTDRASEKPNTKMSLTAIEQSSSDDSALLISSLKQMTINVENYDIDQQMKVLKVQENFTKKDFFEKSSAQKIQKVFRGHLGRKNFREVKAATKIQAAVRQVAVRQARQAEAKGATKLQAVARERIARAEAEQVTEAKIKIVNEFWRRVVQNKIHQLKTNEAKRDAAALKLQAAFRQARQAEQAERARAEVERAERARAEAELARKAEAELARAEAERARKAEVERARAESERAERAERARAEAKKAGRARKAIPPIAKTSASPVQPNLSAQLDGRFSELPNFLQKFYYQDSFINTAQGQQAIFKFHDLAYTSGANSENLSESINSLISLLYQEKVESFKSALRNYLSNEDCIYQLSKSKKDTLSEVLKRSDTKTSLHLSNQASLSQSVGYEARLEIGGGADGYEVPESSEDSSEALPDQTQSQGALSHKVDVTEQTFAETQKESLKQSYPTRTGKIDELFAKIYQSLPIGNKDETFKLEEYKMAMGELVSICNQVKSSKPSIERIKSSLTTSEKYNLSVEEKELIKILLLNDCKRAYDDKQSTDQEAKRRAELARQAEEVRKAEQAEAERASQARVEAEAEAERARAEAERAEAERARQAEAEQAEAATKIKAVVRGHKARVEVERARQAEADTGSVYDSVADADSDAESIIEEFHHEGKDKDKVVDLQTPSLSGDGLGGFNSTLSSRLGLGSTFFNPDSSATLRFAALRSALGMQQDTSYIVRRIHALRSAALRSAKLRSAFDTWKDRSPAPRFTDLTGLQRGGSLSQQRGGSLSRQRGGSLSRQRERSPSPQPGGSPSLQRERSLSRQR